MKKINTLLPAFLLATLLIFANGLVHAEKIAFDPGDLSNEMSRALSLTETFFGRFDGFTDSFVSDTPWIDGTISLSAVWYDGYSIKTDFGNQEGKLGRVYGDLFAGIQGKTISLALGSGGYRYGVFLDDIRLSVPSDDPAGAPLITDFTGTQFFQDIFAASLTYQTIGFLTGFLTTSREFAPAAGIVDLKTPETMSWYVGSRIQLLQIISGETLFSSTGDFISAGGSFDPMALTFVLLKRDRPSGVKVNSGIRWETFGNNTFKWSRFTAPVSLMLGSKKKVFTDGGAAFCSPSLQKELGTFIRSAYGEAGVTFAQRYKLDGGISFYADPRMAGFTDGTKHVFGGKAGFTYSYPGVYAIELGFRRNYYSDLEDLVETVHKNVYYLNLICNLPTVIRRK